MYISLRRYKNPLNWFDGNMKLLRTMCDWIWENVHSPQIQFLNLGDSYNDFGMMDRFEFLKDYGTSIPLLSLEVSNF